MQNAALKTLYFAMAAGFAIASAYAMTALLLSP